MKTTNYLAFPLPLRSAVGAIALVIASASFAQSETPMPSAMPSNQSSVKYGDRSFLTNAAKAGETEIGISNVAASRSENPQVKEFAQMLVSDHRNLASELSTLAGTKGVELPAKEASTSKWEKKSAKEFDKDYLKEMVDEHEDDVELFAKAAKSDDSQIATFAARQLPTLQTHLSKAKELLQALK